MIAAMSMNTPHSGLLIIEARAMKIPRLLRCDSTWSVGAVGLLRNWSHTGQTPSDCPTPRSSQKGVGVASNVTNDALSHQSVKCRIPAAATHLALILSKSPSAGLYSLASSAAEEVIALDNDPLPRPATRSTRRLLTCYAELLEQTRVANEAPTVATGFDADTKVEPANLPSARHAGRPGWSRWTTTMGPDLVPSPRHADRP